MPDAVKGLPATMTVYRGQSADASPGLSWTLDRKVAERFARGHRGMKLPNPVVLEITVSRDDVALFITDRDEAEVVLFEAPGIEDQDRPGRPVAEESKDKAPQARQLRRDGLSVRQIAEVVGAPRSTVGKWVKDIPTELTWKGNPK